MNQVNLTGRLVRDPETRHTQSGLVTTSFTLAVDKQLSKAKKEELRASGKPTADFPRIITWGKVAEIASENLVKGRKVLIEGILTTGKYEDNNGATHYTTDVIANKIEFMDSQRHQEQVPKTEAQSDFTSDDWDDQCPF